MDFRFVTIALVATLAGLATIALWYASSAPIGQFSYASPDGKGVLTYACELRGSAEESQANAQEAHRFYWASISAMAHGHANALYGQVSNYSKAPDMSGKSDALRKVDELQSTVASDRKSLRKELRRLFGCRYVSG